MAGTSGWLEKPPFRLHAVVLSFDPAFSPHFQNRIPILFFCLVSFFLRRKGETFCFLLITQVPVSVRPPFSTDLAHSDEQFPLFETLPERDTTPAAYWIRELGSIWSPFRGSLRGATRAS